MPNVYFSQKILTTALLKEIVNKQKNGICKVQNWLLGYLEQDTAIAFQILPTSNGSSKIQITHKKEKKCNNFLKPLIL